MTLKEFRKAWEAGQDFQYFSKWRKEWVDFDNRPNEGDFKELKKCYYEIRIKP